ncbi:MAG: hypothetical protein Q8P41_02965 [Pseudomonadota bacterium]|nr:hypothetical protein [Pseudomonadota bacterium]
MRAWRCIALACVAVGACMPLVEGDAVPPNEQGTYDTAVRGDLPAPADEGDAPYAGSLGPPKRMVVPVLPGPTTTTREGSGGPPIRDPESTEPWRPVESHYLQGPNADAWRRSGGRRDGSPSDEATPPQED